MKREPKTTFEEVRKELPACIGGFDPWQTKTIDDLAWLVQLEVDLYDEEGETDIQTAAQYRQCQRFLSKYPALKEAAHG